MPPVSQAQRKAMFAAKEGKSTIGIPKKVGAEFAAADKGGKLPEKKMQASTKKRDAPNVGPGKPRDFKGTNKGYAGATKDRNTASISRERAIKASGERSPAGPAVDRSAHWPGNPGFPSSPEAGSSPPPATLQSHEEREREVMGAGYKQHEAAERGSSPNFNELVTTTLQAHSFPTASNSHGYGHGVDRRNGALRLSGHPGAHRIGKK